MKSQCKTANISLEHPMWDVKTTHDPSLSVIFSTGHSFQVAWKSFRKGGKIASSPIFSYPTLYLMKRGALLVMENTFFPNQSAKVIHSKRTNGSGESVEANWFRQHAIEGPRTIWPNVVRAQPHVPCPIIDHHKMLLPPPKMQLKQYQQLRLLRETALVVKNATSASLFFNQLIKRVLTTASILRSNSVTFTENAGSLFWWAIK